MHRTQLLLDDWQYVALKAQAEGSRRSISDLVRQIVSAHLGAGGPQTRSRMLDVEGVAEGPSDLASRHDTYLYGSTGAPATKRTAARPSAARRPPKPRHTVPGFRRRAAGQSDREADGAFLERYIADLVRYRARADQKCSAITTARLRADSALPQGRRAASPQPGRAAAG